MAYFGKTPLTKNVSKFVQDFNANLQYEMGLMYAPQNTQVNAVVAKMKEDAAYQQQKQQSIQKAMGSMIAADRGMNPADAAALAQMMAPPTPKPTPKPAPSKMAPPTPMPTPMTGTGRTGGEVDPTTGLPFTFMPTPMGMEIDPSTGQPFMPPPLMQGGPGTLPIRPMGPGGLGLPDVTSWPGNIKEFLQQGALASVQGSSGSPAYMGAALFPEEILGASTYGHLVKDESGASPTAVPPPPMGGPAIQFPDVTSWPGNILGAAQDVGSYAAGLAKDLITQSGEKTIAELKLDLPEPPVGRTGDVGGAYQEEMDAFKEAFQDPKVDATGRINLIRDMLKFVHETDPGGLNILAGLLYEWLRNPTAEGGQPAPFDTNIISDIQPFLTQVRSYAEELLAATPGPGMLEGEVIPGEVTPGEVTPGEIVPGEIVPDDTVDDLQKTIAESEAQQPAVKGQSYLDWLSAVDTGKNQIYEYFKDTTPRFQLMSPYAESVYGKAEEQMRHQYNLESLDSTSQWFGRSAETPEAANQNYLDYLKAAFDPGVRTANLWTRQQWGDKLQSIYQSAFADKGQTIVDHFGAGAQPRSYVSGALPDELLAPSTTAEVAASAFKEYARNPATVMEWIKAKSLKGANPIISFYGPAAVERSVNKWLIENTPSMDIGVPTDDPGGLGAIEAAEKAAMSLFETWAGRDFQWFKKEGQSRKGYAAS